MMSKISTPGISLDKDQHQWEDRLPIYRCTVEKPPSEQRRAKERTDDTVHALPDSSKSRAQVSRLRNDKVAPSLDSSPSDLSFGGGFVAMGAPMHRSHLRQLRSRTATTFELQKVDFQASKRQSHTSIGFLEGRSTIWR